MNPEKGNKEVRQEQEVRYSRQINGAKLQKILRR
jgi:hypothetical protein